MKPDFLINGSTAKKIYSEIHDLPIIDFHCHLSPKEIYEDKPFRSITEMWLSGDHYKWRAMRYAGVDEKYITGDADDFEKFYKFAKVLCRIIGSPLTHWVQMELSMYFGIDTPLNETTARDIFDRCNSVIRDKQLSPQKLIKMSSVELIATTDDPCDNLEYHKKLSGFKAAKVIPTYRPDAAMKLENPDFTNYLARLSDNITDYESYIKALTNRLDYFKENGCVSSDHSIESVDGDIITDSELNEILKKRITGYALTDYEISSFKLSTIFKLAREYADRGMVMQLHIGALRNNSTRLFNMLGADIGCDSPNDFNIAEKIGCLLKLLDEINQLPKTIVYNLNSKDNPALAALACNYSKSGSPGHVQFGAAWWHADNLDGIRSQLETIKNQSMLPWFVGMLTDSRSFLSYARHDYFRRILSSFLAQLIDSSDYCDSIDYVIEVAKNISYYNAERYFK